MKKIISLLGNIILSGLLLLIALIANVVMVGLLIDVFTGEYETGVKIFCVVFVIVIEGGFFYLLRIMHKALWKDEYK